MTERSSEELDWVPDSRLRRRLEVLMEDGSWEPAEPCYQDRLIGGRHDVMVRWKGIRYWAREGEYRWI